MILYTLSSNLNFLEMFGGVHVSTIAVAAIDNHPVGERNIQNAVLRKFKSLWKHLNR